MTRAALRAQAQDDPDAISIHEDDITDTPQENSLQEEDASRPVLKDITDDNHSTTTDEVTELKQSTRVKKPETGKKKGKQAQTDQNALDIEVTEAQAEQSPSNKESGEEQTQVEEQHVEAPETLASAGTPAMSISEPTDTMSTTPEKPVLAISKTPKFDPQMHVPVVEPPSDSDTKDDSFVESIKTRSPVKLSRQPSRDSFVDSIKSRSPARRTSRIEDSVEAMDALEDAIEEISIKLPQIEHLEVESPIKLRQSPPKTLPPSARKTAITAKGVAKTPKSASKSPIKSKPVQLKPAPPRTTSGRVSTVKPVAKGPTITKSTTRPSVVPKATNDTEGPKMMSFSNSPLKQHPNHVKRVTSGPLSTSRPGFLPAKSSKPPTKSTFILPGEAVSAKFKAQREERAKKAEEEKNNANKSTFKARPVPTMTGRPSVAPRENKASLARKSSALTAPGSEDKENTAPKARPSIAASANTRALDVKKVRPEAAAVRANSSVRRTAASTSPPIARKPVASTRLSIPPKPAPKPVTRPSMAPRVASLAVKDSSCIGLTIPKSTTALVSASASRSSEFGGRPNVKLSGKEIYSRGRNQREAEEKEKRELEESKRKARAEAAEKGRVASREWAERQQMKKAGPRIVSEQNIVVGSVVEEDGGLVEDGPGPAVIEDI